MQPTRKKLGCVIAAFFAAGQVVVAGNTFAQQAPTPPAAQKVEKIEVTGSNIKRVDAEGSAPIQVITRDEIANSGKQTLTDLLRTLPTNAGGGLNDITGVNSFSSGASTVSLRARSGSYSKAAGRRALRPPSRCTSQNTGGAWTSRCARDAPTA